jgi:molecular chaperone DnaK (HSP70)
MNPPPYSTSRDNLSPAFESKSDLVVAIDFGTTFSGVAYAHASNAVDVIASISDMKKVAEKVTVVRTWPNQAGTFTDKTPTVLAYNSSPPHWGMSVQPNDKPRAAYFKLGLQENVSQHYADEASLYATMSMLGGYLIDHNWKHPDLPQKKPVDFTADYLTCLIDHILTEVLPRQFGADFLKNQKLSYVITVPAIWSDKAKELTRQAAVRAGIARKRLTLITEPEAAALFCATLCTDMDLREGDRFMVCDAGGGTVVCS